MRTPGTLRTIAAVAAGLALLSGCGGGTAAGTAAAGGPSEAAPSASPTASPTANLKRLPGIGDTLWSEIPADSRQIVAVYGDSASSADATLAVYTKDGGTWSRERTLAAHNGKRGWTTDHREGDRKSPVGVFTLSDAGGVLPDPDSRLPYHQDASFQAPHYWSKSHWHDFDYVIAIDYNRVEGTSPNDPTRPLGQSKGGSIWLHMDHGSGTSACVSVSKSGMEYLLTSLDPSLHPVIVMGDKAHLAG